MAIYREPSLPTICACSAVLIYQDLRWNSEFARFLMIALSPLFRAQGLRELHRAVASREAGEVNLLTSIRFLVVGWGPLKFALQYLLEVDFFMASFSSRAVTIFTLEQKSHIICSIRNKRGRASSSMKLSFETKLFWGSGN